MWEYSWSFWVLRDLQINNIPFLVSCQEIKWCEKNQLLTHQWMIGGGSKEETTCHFEVPVSVWVWCKFFSVKIMVNTWLWNFWHVAHVIEFILYLSLQCFSLSVLLRLVMSVCVFLGMENYGCYCSCHYAIITSHLPRCNSSFRRIKFLHITTSCVKIFCISPVFLIEIYPFFN